MFKHYLNIFTKKKFDKNVNIDPLIENFLIKYDWPGNIFEVMNVAQNLVNDMISLPEILMIDDIKKMIDNSPINSDLYDLNYKEAKERFERDFIIQKLKNNNWNMTLTSKSLNLDRVSLYRKLKTLNIKID